MPPCMSSNTTITFNHYNWVLNANLIVWIMRQCVVIKKINAHWCEPDSIVQITVRQIVWLLYFMKWCFIFVRQSQSGLRHIFESFPIMRLTKHISFRPRVSRKQIQGDIIQLCLHQNNGWNTHPKFRKSKMCILMSQVASIFRDVKRIRKEHNLNYTPFDTMNISLVNFADTFA